MGQVVCADIRWRYLRRARVPRTTGAYALNPRSLDVFGDPRRIPYLITLMRPGCYHYTTEFREPFTAESSRKPGRRMDKLLHP